MGTSLAYSPDPRLGGSAGGSGGGRGPCLGGRTKVRKGCGRVVTHDAKSTAAKSTTVAGSECRRSRILIRHECTGGCGGGSSGQRTADRRQRAVPISGQCPNGPSE